MSRPATLRRNYMHGPHAMHDAFEQFGAFSQDALDNKALLARAARSPCRYWPSAPRNLSVPEWPTSYALWPATSPAASFPTPVIGSWKKTPQATIKLITDFLAK